MLNKKALLAEFINNYLCNYLCKAGYTTIMQ